MVIDFLKPLLKSPGDQVNEQKQQGQTDHAQLLWHVHLQPDKVVHTLWQQEPHWSFPPTNTHESSHWLTVDRGELNWPRHHWTSPSCGPAEPHSAAGRQVLIGMFFDVRGFIGKIHPGSSAQRLKNSGKTHDRKGQTNQTNETISHTSDHICWHELFTWLIIPKMPGMMMTGRFWHRSSDTIPKILTNSAVSAHGCHIQKLLQ